MPRLLTFALAALCSALLLTAPGYTDDAGAGADDTERVNAFIGDSLFNQSIQFGGQSEIKLEAMRDATQVFTLLEVRSESDRGFQSGLQSGDNLDSLISAYPAASKGLNITRFSTTWQHGDNALTVGSDWSNFQDLLSTANYANVFTELKPLEPTAQVRWAHGANHGFSIALEEGLVLENTPSGTATKGNPNLILSWQGHSENGDHRYLLSALGTRLPASETTSSDAHPQEEQEERIGWGIKMSGGWRFGDLFAALGVSVGNGIDYLLLNRFDNDLAGNATRSYGRAFVINPRLNYSIQDKGSIHLELNHYQSAVADEANEIDTLDTVHLGYTWNPWPGTQFGVELIGKEVEGGLLSRESAQLKFGAEKRF